MSEETIVENILKDKKQEDMAISAVGQLDLTLADIVIQIDSILAEEKEDVIIMKTLALKQYVKGFRDGHRFGKPNPYLSLEKN